MKYKIYNTKIVTENDILKDLAIYLEDGKIVGIKKDDREEGFIGIDAKGMYTSPGFIDMHVHGGGDSDFLDCTVDDFLIPAKMHLSHGTTSIVPTTLSGKTDELLHMFEIYREAKKKNIDGAEFLGLHLEGPYFSAEQCGAQDPEFVRLPDENEYKKILDSTEDIIRWSAAPELEGALKFGDYVSKKNILCSIGHSNATYEQVKEAFQHGFTHITHLYSCMSTVHRINAYRYAGVLESAYMIDDMTVEIIADGVHLPESLLKFVCKFKGTDKTALVSDAMRGAGMPDGLSILGSRKNGQKVVIEDNVAKLVDRSAFAGSVATGDRLVRNMITLASCSMCDAVKMMSLVPAKILGFDNKKGRIKKGYDADIVIFDENINVKYVFVKGKLLKGE